MKYSTQTVSGIEFARIDNDINGNPRYVCHFLNLLGSNENHPVSNYEAAVKKAKTIGGRKYTAKWYGGGIVFQSYNIGDLAKSIIQLRNK